MNEHIQHWNYIFEAFIDQFWDGQARAVPVFLKDLEQDKLGSFECTPDGFNSILLAKNQELTNIEMLGVLLHETCHHVAFEKHGIYIEPHGHEWQAEMKQAGFSGIIDELTDGCLRFDSKSARSFFDTHFERIKDENIIISKKDKKDE